MVTGSAPSWWFANPPPWRCYRCGWAFYDITHVREGSRYRESAMTHVVICGACWGRLVVLSVLGQMPDVTIERGEDG